MSLCRCYITNWDEGYHPPTTSILSCTRHEFMVKVCSRWVEASHVKQNDAR